MLRMIGLATTATWKSLFGWKVKRDGQQKENTAKVKVDDIFSFSVF